MKILEAITLVIPTLNEEQKAPFVDALYKALIGEEVIWDMLPGHLQKVVNCAFNVKAARSEAGKKGMLSRWGEDNKHNKCYNKTDNKCYNKSYNKTDNKEEKFSSNSLQENSLFDNVNAIKNEDSIDNAIAINSQIYLQERKLKKERSSFSSDLGFIESEEMREIFASWLAYKKERKETYKSQQAIKAGYTKLKNLARGDPEIARKIIENSMACNYAGLFPLKEQQQFNQRRDTNYLDVNSRLNPDEWEDL